MKINREKLRVLNYHLFGFSTKEQATAVDTHSTGEGEGQSGRFLSVRNFRCSYRNQS